MSDRNIIVEFSGWCELDPEKTIFLFIGDDGDGDFHSIKGDEWLKLSDEKRSDYILESVITAQQDALDVSYEHIDVFEDDRS